MKTIFQSRDYDKAAVTRVTVEFSDESNRRPWVIREYAGTRHVHTYRSEGSEITTHHQDTAKRLGCEVAVR